MFKIPHIIPLVLSTVLFSSTAGETASQETSHVPDRKEILAEHKWHLDDIYASEKCGGSVFRAVVMMAHEARFINEQARLGYLQLTKKPTTIAMYKFKEDKLSIKEKVEEQEVALEADSLGKTSTDIDLPSEKVDEAADAAFGG